MAYAQIGAAEFKHGSNIAICTRRPQRKLGNPYGWPFRPSQLSENLEIIPSSKGEKPIGLLESDENEDSKDVVRHGVDCLVADARKASLWGL